MELSIGISTKIRAKIKDLFFIPTPEKLIINPSKEEEELFKLADKAASTLYDTLSYTPIAAIGHNFSYELEENEAFSIDINFGAVNFKDIYNEISASPDNSSFIQHSLYINDDTDVVLNLSCKIIDGKRYLSMNYHYQVNNNNEKIRNGLSKFHKNYIHSKITNSKLIRR